MVKYGKYKRRGSTIHPRVGSDKNISKSSERFKVKNMLSNRIKEGYYVIYKSTTA